MKNKKVFQNLFHSICVTLLLLLCILIYSLALWFAVLNPSEGTNPIVTLIAFTSIFGTGTVCLIVIIVKFGYTYWILLDDSIVFKKLFRKKIIIKFDEIIKVEKKTINALILGVYKCEAYVIDDSKKTINILIDKNKTAIRLLETEISKFIQE